MKKVYAYAHTHWDREWYREYEEFRVRLVEVFDDILNKLKNNELKTFYFDGQTSALEDYLEIKPQNETIIKQFIKEGRLFVGPYYCSTDSFLVDAESLIKNLQYGIKKSKELGCNEFISYNADTFGHSAHLPSIIKHFEIEYGMFWRGCGELPSEFIFNGLKSTYLIQGYFQDFFSLPFDSKKKAEMLKNTLDKISQYSENNILLPLGADHLALADKLEQQIDEVNKYLSEYEIILTTPFEYFKNANFKKTVSTELRDNSRNFILPGVFSSRIDLKQQNAKLQWELSRMCGPLQALTSYLDYTPSFQCEIDYAYKTLMKNQAHDSIYGCGIDNIHSENIMRYKKVSQVTNAVKNTVLKNFINDSSDKITVFNLSNYTYTGAVKVKTTKKLNAQLINKTKGFEHNKVYDKTQIPITEDYTDIYEYLVEVDDLKPFSINNLPLTAFKSNLDVTNNSIENKNIKLTVENGKINIFDKINKKDYNDILRIIDRADIGDSYNFGALGNDKKLYAKILSSKIKEKGPSRNILEIKFEIKIPDISSAKGRSKNTKAHLMKMTVGLENRSEFLDIKIDWKNKSLNHLLQVEFNLNSPVLQTISDDLCGTIERDFDAYYDIYEKIPAPRGVELKYNIAPMQKFVVAQDLSLLTEGLNEYEVFKNNLMLTILRSTGTISNPKNPTRGTPAGPPLPTPELQMLKDNSVRFAIALNQNTKKMYELSEKFYGCTLAVPSIRTECLDLFETKNTNLLLNALKTNSEGDLIIRFVNKTTEKQHLDFSLNSNLPYKKIFKANAEEEIIEEFQPYYIQPQEFAVIVVQKQ